MNKVAANGVTVRMTLNGKPVEVVVPPYMTLLELLRDEFKLYGAREGCGVGVCGACTVLRNGEPVSSCLLLAPLADGAEIVTVEGLAENGKLHPVQEAFAQAGASQCGFCTSGLILATVALLRDDPNADEGTVREYLAGNLCRCTGYVKILDAVRDAQKALAP